MSDYDYAACLNNWSESLEEEKRTNDMNYDKEYPFLNTSSSSSSSSSSSLEEDKGKGKEKESEENKDTKENKRRRLETNSGKMHKDLHLIIIVLYGMLERRFNTLGTTLCRICPDLDVFGENVSQIFSNPELNIRTYNLHRLSPKLDRFMETKPGTKPGSKDTYREISESKSLLIKLAQLYVQYHKLNDLNERLEKVKKIQKHRVPDVCNSIKKAIVRWNEIVGSDFRFPTINTKSKPLNNAHLLKDGGSTLCPLSDSEGYVTIYVVLHKTGKRHCFRLAKDEAENWIRTLMENPNPTDFKFSGSDVWIECKTIGKKIRSAKNILMKKLWVPCPQPKGSQTCGGVIFLSTLFPHAAKDDKKFFSLENLMKIYMRCEQVSDKQRQSTAEYCSQPRCPVSELGFHHFIDSDYSPDQHMIKCQGCQETHVTHYHKRACPVCKISFCGCCKSSPYHDDVICVGDKNKLELHRQGIRSCPTCDIACERLDGCDHMKCTCGTEFCWRCMAKLNHNSPYRHKCIPSGEVEGNINLYYHDGNQEESDNDSDDDHPFYDSDDD